MIALLALAALAHGPAPAAPALVRLSDAVAQQVVGLGLEPPLALTVDGPSHALAIGLETTLASVLTGQTRPTVVVPVEGSEAHALRRGARALVRLTVTVEGAQVVVRGDAYSLWQNFWSGRSAGRSGPAGALAAAIAVDDQVSLLAGAPPTTTEHPRPLRLVPFATLPGLPAALACGDLTNDGAPEIAVLVDERVLVLGRDAGVIGHAELSAPSAPAFPREPYGLLVVVSAPLRLVAWSARRAKAEVLTWGASKLRPSGLSELVPLGELSLKLEPGRTALLEPSLPPGTQTVTRRGALTLLTAADGTARLSTGAGSPRVLPAIGAGTTLADLDGNGALQLVASSARTVGDDVLRVISLPVDDAGVEAWSTPLAGARVIVATACALDDVPGEEVVLGVWRDSGEGALLVLHHTESP